MSEAATLARDATPPGSWLNREVACAILVAMGGSIGYIVVPLVVAALRNSGKVAELWIGLIGSADPAGMFLGGLLALHPVFRRRLRLTALAALAISMACNAGSLVLQSTGLLLMLRISAGCSGGVALAVALTVMGRGTQPDRNFALLTLLQMVFGMVTASFADAGSSGLGRIYGAMFLTQILGLVAAATFPAKAAVVADELAALFRAGKAKLDPRLMTASIAGNVFSAAGFLILWSNIEALSSARGVAPGEIILVFDAGLAGGFAGTALNLAVDGRRRRQALCTGLFLTGLTSIAVIGWPFHVALLYAGAFFFQLSTAVAAYGFGAVAEADRTGRLPIIHILAVKAGFAVAPFTASMLIATSGLGIVVPAAFVITLASMLSYRVLLSRAQRIIAATD